eukprot:XP_001697024.1 predicted protein [Chlamydomonas reinhardtii]
MSTARLGGVLFMPCGGTCPPSALTRVIGNVRDIIHRSQDAKIRSNEKGFQRTPAFIHAAVLDALALEVAGGGGTTGTGSWKKTVARGGTTDVGQHTGGDTVRNTCWPLVQATIQVSLLRMGVCGPHQQPNLLFRRAMAHMDLWLLRRQVQCMDSPSAATPVALTATMHMLQATAAKAANLAAEGEDVSTFEKACQSVRQSLEAVASERAWKAAEQHCVPPAGSEAALGELLWPRGTLPGLPPAQLAAGGLEAAKQRESANLGTVPLLEPGASFQKVLGMLQEPLWVQPSGDAAAQLVLRSVEHDLFARVTQLATGRNGGSSSHTAQMSDADLSALTAVVDSYRDALHSFLRTAAAQSVMQCELRSREVLVVWCAYCLAHNAEARRHGLVREYQPALQFADLRHLVLSDRRAVDALLAVAAYLHKQQQCGGPLLFSLRDGGSGTFRFAERFAAADGHLQQILVSERQDADRRQSAHWDKVQQQKRDLQQARQQLAALKAAETCLHEHLVKHDQETTYLQQVQQQLAALEMTQGRLCWQLAQHDRDKTYLQQAQQELAAVRKTEQSLREQLSGAVETTCVWQRQNQRATIARNISTNASQQNQCNYEIARLEKPPEAVLQPLPAADGLARQWLFFLHMPPAFRRLARLSFLAQQVLLPRPLGAWSPELAAVQKAVTLADGQDGCVKLYADGQLPSHVGPASIELYTSPADGVWHPDSLRPSMLWGGSGSTADSGSGLPSYFNPFAAVNENTIEEFFTERLPDSAAALQWAAHQRISAQATPPERSNWALAGQDACPAELLSKAAFLQFGRMRAYPLQQLRNLCEVLRRQDQALPLTEPAVQVLLRQLLFHVGALTIDSNISTDGARPQLIWRTGWEQPGDVLDTLCSELGALADTLDGKVRDHDAILLLGEMAAYLADWHSPCSAVARRFAAIAMLEADRMQVELDAAAGLAADDRRVSELLARLVRWRVMALLCYGAGPLSPAAAGRGARQQQSKDAATMVRLMVQVCHGLTFQTDRAMQQELELLRTRAHNVMASRVQRLGELLTSEDLTAAVASVLERTPDSLLWQRLSQAQQLTACYRAEGADGRLYSINILDGTVLFDGWPPSRLPKDITQHPLYKRTFGNFNFEVAFTGGASSASQGGGAVVLQTLRKVRGRRYDFRLCAAAGGKQQQLVITEMDVEHGDERLELLDAGPDSSCEGWGEQLPSWLWRQLLLAAPPLLVDRLVLPQGSKLVDNILAKFEEPRFIHTFLSVSSEVSFELPRCGLEFSMQRKRPGSFFWGGGDACCQLISRNYTGYRLRRLQLLAECCGVSGSAAGACGDNGSNSSSNAAAAAARGIYTLPEFRQYLVLERIPQPAVASMGGQRADVLVLVPAGAVQSSLWEEGSGGKVAVSVTLPSGSQASVNFHCYEVHGRFGHLRAPNRLARLQLAALYAATSTLLPEPGSRCTGAQMAMELLRQCWSTRPLEAAEAEQLAALAHLHAVPADKPAAAAADGPGAAGGGDIAARFDAQDTAIMPRLCADHAQAYEELQRSAHAALPPGWGAHPRLLLTPVEEERTFEAIAALGEALPLAVSYVEDTEAELQDLLLPPAPAVDGASSQAMPPYPLSAAARATTSRHRRNLEAHLLHQLMHVPESVGCHGASIRLLRAAATAPAAGPLDLARVAVRPELVNEFNPFLSPEAAQELQRRVRLWLRLCVLEDRLGRIVALAAARRAEGDCLPQLVQELSVHRTWDAAAHPEWLVFEVESQLQIRPQQHTVARMLMEGGDGPIAQLNMGEGKTRVILPMLLLALADGKRVVSLTFLSTLLDEAYAYLHGALCAGVLGRKLFTMPFQRDIELTPARAMRMRAALAHCMRERGVLLLAPEHRLSLELKWKEYLLQLRQASVPAAAGTGSNGGDVEALLAAVLKTPVLSILDESDELLHHRFQLIYACGGRVPLVSFEARTGAMRAVLGAVAQLANSGQLQLPHSTRVLEPPPAVDPTDAECSVGSAAVPAGAFCGLRLLPGPDLEAALPAFHHQLARHVLDHPPFEFQKLTKLLDEGSKVRVMTCITDADTDAETALGAELLDKLAGGVLHSFVLALRGLLGCGLLRHGLTLRHNVEYGIDRRTAAAGVRTRMAVPYRAAHTPSERSEFAQPDVSLLLTHLAYRYDGLTLPEFTAAVERLLHGLGKEAAADHYREWLVLSAESIPKEELSRFKDVNQLDASSGSQMAAMHRHLRRNTAVVDFWLRFCVLPAETRQYPQRLGASAWDLAAAGGRVMGFSGTNDNYRLLPLRVRQAAAEDPALKATNGKMLSVLLQNTHGFHTLPPAEDAGGVAVWQSLLQMALDKSAHALIDCGALLAGTTNRHAAEFLLADPRLQQLGFRGVTFYAERERGWAVLELTGRCLPRSSSPLQEHETFVIYDEARCRGADLKLKRNAVALLTLGPRVCKDKLMQAAGRLRQLGRGQALRFAATADIAARVTLLPAWLIDVLAWVMGNTVDANLHGVALWAAQGLQFATALGAPQLSLQEEVLGLEELYAGSKAPRPVVAVVAAAAAKQLRWRQKQCGSSAGGTAAGGRRMYTAAELMVEIQDLAARYGEGHTVRAGSGADDTCERELELEQEEEEEQEQERQVPKQRPAPEADWSSYRLLPLRDAVTRLDSQDPAQPMAALPWSDKVYVSHNYLHAIAGLPPGQPLNEYLRPVGWLLVLKRGEVLLLSEREADQLLAATWADAPAAKGTTSFRHRLVRYLADTASKRGPLLVSQAYAWQAAAVSSATRPLLVTDLGLTTAGIVQDAADAWAELRRRLGVRELVSVRVFAGETSYRVTRLAGANGTAASSGSAATAAVEAELQRLVAGRRPQVQQLLVMRGRQSQMARSDLEKAVEGLQLQL